LGVPGLEYEPNRAQQGTLMALEPDEPMAQKPAPRNLETLSISELENYIGELEAEIGRARRMIASKRSIRGGADALFKR
jgi:uncharacterized small protein (DUF1192 family)